jgi:hypothetical protein
MQTLRKNIARRSWLLAVLSFVLLAQMQQAVACELMNLSPDQAGQYCQKHTDGMQQMGQAKKAHCDFLFKFSTAGPCHNDPGTVINPSLSGKLHPDYHPVLITTALQEIFTYPSSPPLVLIPERESSRTGTQTYLITQRLRI